MGTEHRLSRCYGFLTPAVAGVLINTVPLSLIVSPSTIDKMFEIYTFFENRTEIYTFFENRFEIYTCILFENRTEILSMVDGLTIGILAKNRSNENPALQVILSDQIDLYLVIN